MLLSSLLLLELLRRVNSPLNQLPKRLSIPGPDELDLLSLEKRLVSIPHMRDRRLFGVFLLFLPVLPFEVGVELLELTWLGRPVVALKLTWQRGGI